VGPTKTDILVAGFEAFQLFQRVWKRAGGVDAVLEPGEGLVALLDGIAQASSSAGWQ